MTVRTDFRCSFAEQKSKAFLPIMTILNYELMNAHTKIQLKSRTSVPNVGKLMIDIGIFSILGKILTLGHLKLTRVNWGKSR